MSEPFLHLSDEDRRQILAAGAQKLGKSAKTLEKDVWVCWALEQLWTMPNAIKMAFKGGTSLSKVYRVIDRFSEDIDVTLDYRALDPTFDPFAEGLSKTKLKTASEELRALMKVHVDRVVAPELRQRLRNVSDDAAYSIEISDDAEKAYVNYRSVVDTNDYIADRVLIEFGGRNITEPNEKHAITPDIAELTNGLVFPTANVDVLSGARTFWEKATLIHVACHKPDARPDASRMSRHWYDLHKLADHDVGRAAVKDRALLVDVVKHKKVFYHVGYANYDACLDGHLRLIPENNAALHADYKQMMDAKMFSENAPAFDDIIQRLHALETEINERNKKHAI